MLVVALLAMLLRILRTFVFLPCVEAFACELCITCFNSRPVRIEPGGSCIPRKGDARSLWSLSWLFFVSR